MSRLIIKNLPNKISSDQLKEKFGKFGEVTDIQLKMTSDGRFRKFAFIGFKTNEQADAAMNFFDNTFLKSSKISVQICRELGSDLKPKSWSKHAKDSLAKKKVDVDHSNENQAVNNKGKTRNVDSVVIDKLKKHSSDPEFADFIALNANTESKVTKLLNMVKEKEVEDSDISDDEASDNENGQKLACADISDAEYLKLKTKGANADNKVKLSKPSNEPKQKKYETLFTIKIKNLPAKIKKKDIKDLLKPIVPASIRRTPCNSSCLAFVGFKTQKELRQSLIKNKSFVKGNQIQISEYIDVNCSQKVNSKWEEQENSLKNEETVGESGRIFLRNLPYTIKEEEVEELFSKYGPVTEIILPLDKLSRRGKGYGIITFLMPEHAAAAFAELDGTIFQGRMLHLLPGKSKHEEEYSGKGYKGKKESELKSMAGSAHNWNTLFLGQNALADLISESYGADKAKVLSGSEGGVRLALGETQLVADTRKFLISNGVCLDAFNNPNFKRSKQIFLVKNLPAKTTEEEVREKFQPFGIIKRLVMPPSGVTAIVEFEEPAEAKVAFKNLAYTKFKNLPLYLEWAPDNTFTKDGESTVHEEVDATEKSNSGDEKDEETAEEPEPDTTLFVKNLNFETTEEDLKNHFKKCGKLAVVSISRKKDASKPGGLLSMGYGFVQFYRKSDLNRALAELQNSELQGHQLELKRSTKTLAVKPVVKRNTTNVEKQTGKKILVRNIPFQASKKEIELLFKTFGELKIVRLPKKMVGTGPHRGFAFIEYVTMHDAKQAMNALCHSTHLYGRRLVLEWAEEEEDVESIRKRTAKHFHPSEAKRSKKGVADIEVEEEED